MNYKNKKFYLVLFMLVFLVSFSTALAADSSSNSEVPWAWYVSRASALLGFVLLYLSILSGVLIRMPILNRIVRPIHSLNFHIWISIQAIFFAFIHGISLLFDKFFGFDIIDIFVPFATQPEIVAKGIDPTILAFGIISFYLMLALVISSLVRKHISQPVWRAIHFLNISLYFLSIIHALYLGTDLRTGILRTIFIYANIFLGILFALNLIIRVIKAIQNRNRINNIDSNQSTGSSVS